MWYQYGCCHSVFFSRSTNTPRAAARKSAAAGFSFRLEQRAEKRKEVSTSFPRRNCHILSCFPFLLLKGLTNSLLPVLPKAWRENPCKGAWTNKFAGKIQGGSCFHIICKKTNLGIFVCFSAEVTLYTLRRAKRLRSNFWGRAWHLKQHLCQAFTRSSHPKLSWKRYCNLLDVRRLLCIFQ